MIEMAKKKTIAEVAEMKILTGKKIAFFEKEKRAGKQKVFRGLKQIKRNIGKPKAMTGILIVRQGHAQVRYAERNITVLKFKKRQKYWK